MQHQTTEFATDGKARMPGSRMSLPSCFENMTTTDAEKNQLFAFWIDSGEDPAVGIRTGAFWFWKKTGKVPNPNVISYCLAAETTFQALWATGAMRTYWSWNYAMRVEFCTERGLPETAWFDDERADQFRKWLRLKALEAGQ